MPSLPKAMLAHLEAVTGDPEGLRAAWAPDGVLEFPYATAEMTSRIEGVDALVAYFSGPKRWGDWHFDAVRVISDEPRRLHVAELHATATWVETGRPYTQDYVIWMELDEQGRIASWREYWDKARV
jgi:ketosteroid isomerase-like protein